MIDWIILAVYTIGYISMWRTTVWTVGMFERFGDTNDSLDVGISICFGSIINLLWPFILGFKLIRNFYGDNENLLMPRNVRKAKELKEREKRIAQLERELDIKSSRRNPNGY